MNLMGVILLPTQPIVLCDTSRSLGQCSKLQIRRSLRYFLSWKVGDRHSHGWFQCLRLEAADTWRNAPELLSLSQLLSNLLKSAINLFNLVIYKLNRTGVHCYYEHTIIPCNKFNVLHDPDNYDNVNNYENTNNDGRTACRKSLYLRPWNVKINRKTDRFVYDYKR